MIIIIIIQPTVNELCPVGYVTLSSRVELRPTSAYTLITNKEKWLLYQFSFLSNYKDPA